MRNKIILFIVDKLIFSKSIESKTICKRIDNYLIYNFAILVYNLSKTIVKNKFPQLRND